MQLPFSPASLVQSTSTGTADVKTLAAPAGATGVLITVLTTSCWMTFDGSTPTAANGLIVQAAAAPLYLSIACANIKFASTAAAASVVNVQWVR